MGDIMSSLVLDLQREVLKSDCDIVNALRKAYLMTTKLNLLEFRNWVNFELNGYSYNENEIIPKYRNVIGTLKIFNPNYGWLPARYTNYKIYKIISEWKLWQPIGEIQELYIQDSDNEFICYFSNEIKQTLSSLFQPPIPIEFALHTSKRFLKNIIEMVKNCMLEWTIRLENEGILGENMRFNKAETKMANNIPQQIINYYGPVVKGDINGSQILSGDSNIVSFCYESVADLITKIRETIENDDLSDEDKESAMEIIDKTENKIKTKKNLRIIKATLSGLRDFLIAAGANVTGALIGKYLRGM